jgi:hypothetical protein
LRAWCTVWTTQVDKKCWSVNAEITKWTKRHRKTSLQRYYGDWLVKMLNGLNRTVIMWEDLFDQMHPGDSRSPEVSVPNGTVVHVWRDAWQKETSRVTGAGYNTILST